ncbi:hypothetical protein JW968_05380 [Candidatus Woesearchaeota archaeon]|nr:hypothetical protein [Candidatus Woesearchaeota archaeon]
MVRRLCRRGGFEDPSVLMKVVLVFFFFFIASVITAEVIKTVNDEIKWREICRASVAKKYAATMGGVLEHEQRIECPTRYMKVMDGGIYIMKDGEFKRIEKMEGSMDEKKETLQFALAAEMANWAYALELSPFGEFKEDFRCMILTELKFDENVPKDMGVPKIVDYQQFLNDHHIKSGDGEKSYSEMIFGQDFEPTQTFDLDLAQDYTLVYYAFKNSWWVNIAKVGAAGAAAGAATGCVYALWGGHIGCAAGGVIGGVIGAVSGGAAGHAKHEFQGEILPAIVLVRSNDEFITQCSRLY